MRLIGILAIMAATIGCSAPPTDQEIRDARAQN